MHSLENRPIKLYPLLLVFFYNPSVAPSLRHLPLHKGGEGKCKSFSDIAEDVVPYD